MRNYSATYIFHKTVAHFRFYICMASFSGALYRETYKLIVWKVSSVSFKNLATHMHFNDRSTQ